MSEGTWHKLKLGTADPESQVTSLGPLSLSLPPPYPLPLPPFSLCHMDGFLGLWPDASMFSLNCCLEGNDKIWWDSVDTFLLGEKHPRPHSNRPSSLEFHPTFHSVGQRSCVFGTRDSRTLELLSTLTHHRFYNWPWGTARKFPGRWNMKRMPQALLGLGQGLIAMCNGLLRLQTLLGMTFTPGT